MVTDHLTHGKLLYLKLSPLLVSYILPCNVKREKSSKHVFLVKTGVPSSDLYPVVSPQVLISLFAAELVLAQIM